MLPATRHSGFFLQLLLVGAVSGCQHNQERDAAAAAGGRTLQHADVVTLQDEPAWAYGFERPPQTGDIVRLQKPPSRALQPGMSEQEQTRPRQVPGSSARYSLLDTYDDQNVIDWFPQDHSPMPDVVKHGPAGMGALARGCAACHLPNGKGRPENAALAGLPVAYFLRQIEDFRAGRRQSSDPRKKNTPTMIALARGMSDAEAREAAEYYSGLPSSPWLRVVVAEEAPSARIGGNLYLPTGDGLTQPLAGRVLEMPEDVAQSEDLGNPHSGFVAYVSPSAVERGRVLAAACMACHGGDLQGKDDIPPIGGRSPSYLARQLYDFRSGARQGQQSAAMRAMVASLSAAELTDLASFLATKRARGIIAP